jgi:hypothetical protein
VELLGYPVGWVLAIGGDFEKVVEGVLGLAGLFIFIGECPSERDICGEEDACVGAGKSAGAGDGVFELADVTGPAVLFEVVERFLTEAQGGDAIASDREVEKMFG